MRLDAEAAAATASEAEFHAQGVAMPLEHSARLRQGHSLPVFDSGRAMTPEAMHDLLYEHIRERSARR